MKWLRLLPLLFVLFALGIVQAGKADLVLSDLDGKEHSLADYKGKWVIVNYWATWCPPCVEEIPELIFFHDQHKNNAVVLGVNFEDIAEAKVRRFVEEQMVSYPILLSEPDRNQPLGRIPGLPTTFIVSPEGDVVARKVGRVDLKYLEKMVGENHAGKIKR